jgi:FeS assembly SUF system protein
VSSEQEKPPFDFPGDPAEMTADVVRPDSDPADAALTARVVEQLKTVRDPEIPVNLIDLGLIYELLVNKDGTVYVEMTLTTPACPAAIALPGEVERAVAQVEGVKDVRVKVVWSPPWTQDRMSDEARLELGLM